MANLIGQSENPNVAGVYGDGDGAGVWGKSKTWVGVIGETLSSDTNAGGAGVWGKGIVGFGVHGESQGGIGVIGDSNWIGVKGETKTLKGIGVLGEHKAGGSAVIGLSPTGIGIHGKGGHRAGFFEGEVEITGILTVQGVSIQSLLRRIQQLEQKVVALSGGTSSGRHIAVSKEGVGPSTVFVVNGSGFTPNKLVVIRITGKQWPFNQVEFSETAGGDGKFVAKRSLPCGSGFPFTITSFEDADPLGTFANSVDTTCG